MKEYESSSDEMAIVDDRQSHDLAERTIGLRPVLLLYFIILTLLLVSSFYLSRYSVINSILISQWVFIFAPCMIFLYLSRVRLSRGLKISRISAKTVTGVILASLSGILLTGELMAWQNDLVPIPAEYLEMLREYFSVSGSVGFPRAAFAFAISPAICEEFFFRGILLQGLIRKVSAPWAIILTGLLFGIIHLDLYRLLGTTVLGFIMGYIAIKTQSLLAAILYHLTNNMMVLLVMNTRQFQEIPWLMEEAHLPSGLLVLSVFIFAVSLKIILPGSVDQVTMNEPGSDCARNISADDP